MSHSDMDFISLNLNYMNDEQENSFYHAISRMEKRYQGKEMFAMLVDYCLTLTNNTKDSMYKRQTR